MIGRSNAVEAGGIEWKELVFADTRAPEPGVGKSATFHLPALECAIVFRFVPPEQDGRYTVYMSALVGNQYTDHASNHPDLRITSEDLFEHDGEQYLTVDFNLARDAAKWESSYFIAQ